MSTAFKALSDPTRREILWLLRRGERTAGQLAEEFAVSAPTMSHHFAALKEADLVTCRRDGTTIYYGLNTTVMQEVMGWIMDLLPPADRGANEARSKPRKRRV